MPKKPSVIFVQSGTPFWAVKDCENITSSRDSPLTTLEESALKGPYSAIADQVNHMKGMTFLKTKNRLTLADVYYGASPMGQNVLPMEAYKCKGPYTPYFSVKTPGGGAAWHPGRLGHQMRGESLAYAFLMSLKSALEDIKEAAAGLVFTNQAVKTLLDQSNQFVKRNTFRSVPEPPVSCGEDDCQTEPRCFTDYQPRVPTASISQSSKDSVWENNRKKHPLQLYDNVANIKGGPLASLLVGPAKIQIKLPVHALNASSESLAALTMEETLRHINRVTAVKSANYNKNVTVGSESESESYADAPGWTFEMSFFDKNAVDKSVMKGLGRLPIPTNTCNDSNAQKNTHTYSTTPQLFLSI
jgi:hypothetical protein